MPLLGDFLGQLLSEISIARMQADLETVRLAELYATHPLLRTMPVPHMRLPSVDMEIPVLIQVSEAPRAGESARGGAPLADMRQKFSDVLATYLVKAEVALAAADHEKIGAALDDRLKVLGQPTETSVDVHRIADDLTATALRVVREIKDTAMPEPIASELRAAVRLELLKLRTPPPRLTVLVTTAEIRESGTAESITRFRLKVSEEGLEWTTIESEGVSRDRLVPE